MTQAELKSLRWQIGVRSKMYYHVDSFGVDKTLKRVEHNSMVREYNREKAWYNKEMKII